MKKYYGYFVYDGEEYVIRFKIKGSLKWNAATKCFEDAKWYVRSIADVICMAAFDSNPLNTKTFSCAYLLTHEEFVKERARGVKRCIPWCEIIMWD